MPLEERVGRERTTLINITNIKKVEEECVKICREIKKIWTELVEDTEMKAKLREAKEEA
jgi:hypothetical protein